MSASVSRFVQQRNKRNNNSNNNHNNNHNNNSNNLLLASILTLFSYIPFEYVAKVALIASATLFVIDPIPPVTRLISLGTATVVFLLARVERLWREYQDYYSTTTYEDDKDNDTHHDQYYYCGQIPSHKSKNY